MSPIRTPGVDRPATKTDGIDAAVEAVRERADPLDDDAIADLAASVSDAEYVMLGEATHGTAEFYRWRARLTAELIRDHDFDFVAVEGDWTDCYAVNRYAKGVSNARSAREVLDAYDRWPTWMWANWEVVEFVEWLREANDGRSEGEEVGFYGMDVYSLFESMRAVVDYLTEIDPEAADRARDAYACFEPYADDAQEYARSTRLAPERCEDEVVEILADLRQNAPRHGDDHDDAHFNAEQNALVAKNAEEYYRTMIRGSAESWNVRDRHMVETLERLRDYHAGDVGGDDESDRPTAESTAIVWAHNTHVGDARATDMARRGEVNVGQLAREAVGRENVALVGFGTHRGSVIAGRNWGAQMERMEVPSAREGSYEDVFHRADLGDAILRFDGGDGGEDDPLADPRGHRAIGVVYHPERELGNYVPTVLPDRYDAFVHVEETEGLHPLHLDPGGAREPETYPWGV